MAGEPKPSSPGACKLHRARVKHKCRTKPALHDEAYSFGFRVELSPERGMLVVVGPKLCVYVGAVHS